MRVRLRSEAGATPSNGTPRGALAASQERRRRRIVDAAVRLAEAGGFEAVRLRDVAEEADVALGTLYKYFRSKEDVLLFALGEEVARLEAAMAAHPARGGRPLGRLTDFFARATGGLIRRPHFARAVLRSIAAGDAKTTAHVAAFHERMTRQILAALRSSPAASRRRTGTRREREVAFVLQHVWFASLVGWAGGLHPAAAVARQVRSAAALMWED